jgi:hypothetical protein
MKTFSFDKLLNILPTATQRLVREADVGVGRRLGCRPERESPAKNLSSGTQRQLFQVASTARR